SEPDLTVVGTAQSVAQGQLVYSLNHSEISLGLVAFIQQVMMTLLTLVGGSLADRMERRRLMFVTQGVMMASGAVLTILAATGIVQVWHIMILAGINGAARGLNIPTNQTMVGDLVPREIRGSAIALNSAQFHASRSIGPALVAVVFVFATDSPGAWHGSAICFGVDALSFGALIWALYIMKFRPDNVEPMGRDLRLELTRFWHGIREAFLYVRTSPTTGAIIVVTAACAFFGMPLISLMPAYSRDVVIPFFAHSVSQQVQGHLLTAAGMGAVIGALGMTTLLRRLPIMRVIMVSAAGYALAILAVALTNNEALGWGFMALTGLCSITYTVLINTQIQTSVPDLIRGRVMAMYSLAFTLSMAMGNVISGFVARATSVPIAWTINACGLLLLLLIGMVLRPRIWWRGHQPTNEA
ncbi:MAG: MFS transporter, partial [bacterium]